MGTTPDSLNLNIRGLSPSATVAINEHSDRLRAEGRDIFKLGLGQSPFPVPDVVVQALKDNAHQKDYLPVKGLHALRQAVADYHRRKGDADRTAEDVLIGPGSKELMFLLQLVFYGDLVLPAPSWVSYDPQARIIGRPVHYVQTSRDNHWCLSANDLAKHCEKDPSRPRLLILNYPNNPTGHTYTDDELKRIADVARKYKVVLLSDEIYGELHHEGAHKSLARHYPEGTIISGGLSKWCGAGGWRLGTMVFPPELRWLLNGMAVAASETYTSTSAPIQHAAVTAYQDLPELTDYLARSRRVVKALGGWIVDKLRSAGIVCPDISGAFYIFCDWSPLREKLAARGITTSTELCSKLLDETGVAILPGSDFGRADNELCMRMAYVDFDGAQALRDASANTTLDEAFLRAHAPRVIEAIERLCQFAVS